MYFDILSRIMSVAPSVMIDFFISEPSVINDYGIISNSYTTKKARAIIQPASENDIKSSIGSRGHDLSIDGGELFFNVFTSSSDIQLKGSSSRDIESSGDGFVFNGNSYKVLIVRDWSATWKFQKSICVMDNSITFS
jgi:hypothetical protein